MTFEEYCIEKKINPVKFSASEPNVFQQFKVEFEQMHPSSFTMQKMFLINKLRRKYK